jgi:hypothetical protein
MVGLTEIVLLSVLAICFITQMIFYWVVLAKPYYSMKTVEKENVYFFSNYPPVSVIIYVRSRFNDLRDFLPIILEQDYPQFEVIIVYDGSSEENKNTFFRLQEQYSNLYSTHIPEDTKNLNRKKLGLTLGIKAAKYDCLLFTEADSHTRSSNWIKLMTRHFGKNNTVVLGFSAKEKERGFFSEFISFDYFYSNLQMLSMALLNRTFTGNSRNLIYSKTKYNEQKGFIRKHSKQQVENNLFINNLAVKTGVKVELSSESVIMTDLNIHDWKREKKGKAFINHFYKAGPVALWNLESFSRSLFLLSIITCFIWGIIHLQTLPYIFGAAIG